MRPLRAWLVYLGLVFVIGALLAPWLYDWVQAGARHLSGLENTARSPFHRFVNRSVLLVALAGLFPLLRYLGIVSWAQLGLVRSPGEWNEAGRGFAVGFVSLACIALLTVGLGAREFSADRPPMEWVRHLLNAGAAALGAGILEEVMFRGALFGSLRREHRWEVALVVSSLVYAWLHFFSSVPWTEPVDWTAGLVILGRMMRGLVEVKAMVPGFVNLALAGSLLALAFQRMGTLHFSIGVHVGWIFWLKTYGFFTREHEGANVWFWGTNRLLDGWVASVVLALTLWGLHKSMPPGGRPRIP